MQTIYIACIRIRNNSSRKHTLQRRHSARGRCKWWHYKRYYHSFGMWDNLQ